MSYHRAKHGGLGEPILDAFGDWKQCGTQPVLSGLPGAPPTKVIRQIAARCASSACPTPLAIWRVFPGSPHVLPPPGHRCARRFPSHRLWRNPASAVMEAVLFSKPFHAGLLSPKAFAEAACRSRPWRWDRCYTVQRYLLNKLFGKATLELHVACADGPIDRFHGLPFVFFSLHVAACCCGNCALRQG